MHWPPDPNCNGEIMVHPGVQAGKKEALPYRQGLPEEI
jgi:hypothetical protein